MSALIAGFAFGIVGSGHCAAMCGPLVLLANPRAAGLGGGSRATRRALAAHAALYHGGRLATYLLLGLVAGLAGSAIAGLGLGRALAVVAGAALVLQALAATHVVGTRLASHRLGALVTPVLGRAGAWMRTHRVRGPALFGALNGLLPCGLLYAALTAAAGLGDVDQALVFMGAFAAGTTPVLAAIGMAGGALTAKVPRAVRRAAPIAVATVGVLLIVRGIGAPHAGHAAPETAVAPMHDTSRHH